MREHYFGVSGGREVERGDRFIGRISRGSARVKLGVQVLDKMTAAPASRRVAYRRLE